MFFFLRNKFNTIAARLADLLKLFELLKALGAACVHSVKSITGWHVEDVYPLTWNKKGGIQQLNQRTTCPNGGSNMDIGFKVIRSQDENSKRGGVELLIVELLKSGPLGDLWADEGPRRLIYMNTFNYADPEEEDPEEEEMIGEVRHGSVQEGEKFILQLRKVCSNTEEPLSKDNMPAFIKCAWIDVPVGEGPRFTTEPRFDLNREAIWEWRAMREYMGSKVRAAVRTPLLTRIARARDLASDGDQESSSLPPFPPGEETPT